MTAATACDVRTVRADSQPTLFDTPDTASHLAADGACMPPVSRKAASLADRAGRCERPSTPATDAAARRCSLDPAGLGKAGDFADHGAGVDVEPAQCVHPSVERVAVGEGDFPSVAEGDCGGEVAVPVHAIIKPQTRRPVNPKPVEDFTHLQGYWRTEAEYPELRDVKTFSAAWYARWRDLHVARFPDLDASSRSNLDMFVSIAEERERADA